METCQRITGSLLVLVAIAVVAQAIVPGDRHNLWNYLNPLMAISILLVIALCAWSKVRRPGGGENGTTPSGWAEADFVLYAGLFIAYLFFYNWIKELDEGEGHSWIWIVVNGMIPVLNVWGGIRLWSRSR